MSFHDVPSLTKLYKLYISRYRKYTKPSWQCSLYSKETFWTIDSRNHHDQM